VHDVQGAVLLGVEKRECNGHQAERDTEDPRKNRSVEAVDWDSSGLRGGMARVS